jgi:hypothetical protein
MLMLSNRRFRLGRQPWDPPLRLWGPILVWQLLCWPVAALRDAICRFRAAGGAGSWPALLDRAAIALVAVGGVLVAAYILRALAAST